MKKNKILILYALIPISLLMIMYLLIGSFNESWNFQNWSIRDRFELYIRGGVLFLAGIFIARALYIENMD